MKIAVKLGMNVLETHNPKHNGSESPIDALCYVIYLLI